MKLRRPPYPNQVGTATYFRTHAGHRETTINLAVDLVRRTASQEVAATPDDAFGNEMTATVRDWAIESLLQGAWIREYHMWERDTKDYFDGHHIRNGERRLDWRQKVPGTLSQSHMVKVKAQLILFSASVPDEAISTIDESREKVNFAKHEAEFFVTEADYRALVGAVAKFWEALIPQEEFTL